MPKIKRKKTVVKAAKVVKKANVAQRGSLDASLIQGIEKDFTSAKNALASRTLKEIDALKKLEKKLKADLSKAEKAKKGAKGKPAAGKGGKASKQQKLKTAAYNVVAQAVEKIKKELGNVKEAIQRLLQCQKKYTALNGLLDKFEKAWVKKKSAVKKPKKAKKKVKAKAKVKAKITVKAKPKAKTKKLGRKKSVAMSHSGSSMG